MKRLVIMAAVVAMALALMPTSALAKAGKASASNGKFVLGGDASIERNPEDHKDKVIRIYTDSAGAAGNAVSELDQVVGSLAVVELDYYLEDDTCSGGGPRIALGIDADGDGGLDGHAVGYIGGMHGTGCAVGAWTHQDMTAPTTHWDTSQLGAFGGAYADTWLGVQTKFGTATALYALLVDDGGWSVSDGDRTGYYDDVVIGAVDLSGPRDVLGN